jgi:ketosteroid isomerase-like protein
VTTEGGGGVGASPVDGVAAYGRAVTARDVGAAVACFAPDAEIIVGGAPHVPFVGHFVGRKEVRRFFQQFFELTTPDTNFRPSAPEVLHQGEQLVVFASFRHQVIATGRHYSGDFALHFVFQDGLIARYHMYENSWSVGNAFDP